MTTMSGFEIFEKITGINDRFIEEAAEMPSPELAVVKTSRWERFSHFINSGWGVAMICAIVAVGVMVGIIAAGRVGGPFVPPVSSGAQPTDVGTSNADTEQVRLLPEGSYITTQSPNSDHHVSLAPWLTSAKDIGFDLDETAYVDPALVGTTKNTPLGVFTYLETVGYSEDLIARGAIDNRVDRYESGNATINYIRANGLITNYYLHEYGDIPDLDTPLTEAECTEMAQAFLEEHVPTDILSALTAANPGYVASENTFTGYDEYIYHFYFMHNGYRGTGDITIDICPTKGVIRRFSSGSAIVVVPPILSLESSQAEIDAAKQQMWDLLESLQLDGFAPYEEEYLTVNAYGEVYLRLKFLAYDNDKSDDYDWMTEAEKATDAPIDSADTGISIGDIHIETDSRLQYTVYIKIS